MVETRAGTNTDVQTPAATQQSREVPSEVEIPAQTQDQQMGTPTTQAQGQVGTPVTPPQVYTAGTYAATYQRPSTVQRSPSVPIGWRPDQFAFLPQPDFATARGDASEEGEIVEGTTPSVPMQPAGPANQAAGGQTVRRLTFEAPMRPLDVSRDMYLDYTTTQSIKFYNKGCEKLPGEAFSGKLLLTWLVQVQDKAMMFTWIPILTINGRLLTQHFSEISMEEVRAHAQVYQNRATRAAQNAEMLIQCLKASISRTVYNKVYLQMSKYIIYRSGTGEPVEDGVCFLKTIIDSYHSSTRSSTKQIRKQLAQLNYYMRNVAKGDVTKLCEHTRELMYELNAAGETTNDLLANLIEALKEAPDSNFQRWLGNQVDLWSMKQIDWKEDGSDLMDSAEIYYKEAINTHRWGRKTQKQDFQYAFQAVGSGEDTEVEKEEKPKAKSKEQSYEDTIKALTAQLQEYATAYTAKWSGLSQPQNKDKKYAWKLIPPKAGEPSVKSVLDDGKRKTYHWCPYHNQWTIHSPSECKKLKGKGKKEKKAFKRQNFKEKKKAYIHAKAALRACKSSSSSSEESSNKSESDEDSNKSHSSYSSEDSNVS